MLLSGAPGIGKSTVAKLAAQYALTRPVPSIASSLSPVTWRVGDRKCGYEIIELNASDVRNKSSIKEQTEDMISNRSMSEYFKGSGAPKKKKGKTVLIMVAVPAASPPTYRLLIGLCLSERRMRWTVCRVTPIAAVCKRSSLPSKPPK
jgi:hypothetical protein